MLTVSIPTKNPKTPVLDARSTNIKATKRPHVDFKALKRTHLQYSSPMETCAYHFTSTPASSMSHSTLSNVGLLAINSFQFSTYLLSPKTQWAITSSLHQLPGDLTFFTWLSKTHQSISSPSKFTSIWGRLRISEQWPKHLSSAAESPESTERPFLHQQIQKAHWQTWWAQISENSSTRDSWVLQTLTHLLGKMNKQKPLTKRGRYQKVKPYDSKSKITLQPSFGYFLPCLAKYNSGSVCHVGFPQIQLVQAMTASLITV